MFQFLTNNFDCGCNAKSAEREREERERERERDASDLAQYCYLPDLYVNIVLFPVVGLI